MNKKQLRRIALVTTASEIIYGCEMEAVTDKLTEKEIVRFEDVRREIACQMIKKARFKDTLSVEELFRRVLNNEFDF